MKTERTIVDSASIPWESVNEHASRKVLNGDANSGPHTVILKSAPRTPDPHRGQFHGVYEEFYCLGGNFTFDGRLWFRKGSYVHFPAKCVHGARVHVKDGYLVYLRMGGTVTLDFLDNPKSDSPYVLDEGASAASPITLGRVPMIGRAVKTHGVPWIKSRLLRTHPDTGEGTTLISLKKTAPYRVISLKSKKELEVFVLSGAFEDATGNSVKAGAYAFHMSGSAKGGPVELSLLPTSASRILVSHGSDLTVSVA